MIDFHRKCMRNDLCREMTDGRIFTKNHRGVTSVSCTSKYDNDNYGMGDILECSCVGRRCTRTLNLSHAETDNETGDELVVPMSQLSSEMLLAVQKWQLQNKFERTSGKFGPHSMALPSALSSGHGRAASSRLRRPIGR